MTTIVALILMCTLGLALYVLSVPAKVNEIGRLTFAIGLAILALVLAVHRVGM